MNILNQQPETPEKVTSKNETMSEIQKIEGFRETLREMLRSAKEAGNAAKIKEVEEMIEENEARSVALDSKYLVERSSEAAKEAAREKIDEANTIAGNSAKNLDDSYDYSRPGDLR